MLKSSQRVAVQGWLQGWLQQKAIDFYTAENNVWSAVTGISGYDAAQPGKLPKNVKFAPVFLPAFFITTGNKLGIDNMNDELKNRLVKDER